MDYKSVFRTYEENKKLVFYHGFTGIQHTISYDLKSTVPNRVSMKKTTPSIIYRVPSDEYEMILSRQVSSAR